MKKARPARPKRRGVGLVELLELFPDDRAAEAWFESRRWADGIYCPDCGSGRYSDIKDRKPMPYRCKDCHAYFSVRKGTTMQSSKLGYQTWALAIHLVATSVKGVRSAPQILNSTSSGIFHGYQAAFSEVAKSW